MPLKVLNGELGGTKKKYIFKKVNNCTDLNGIKINFENLHIKHLFCSTDTLHGNVFFILNKK